LSKATKPQVMAEDEEIPAPMDRFPPKTMSAPVILYPERAVSTCLKYFSQPYFKAELSWVRTASSLVS